MNRLLIASSIIPCLPILMFGVFFVVHSGAGLNTPLWIFSAIAVLLGVTGVVGLIMAGLKNTYSSPKCRLFSMTFIFCGFIAIGFGIAWMVTAYQIETQYAPDGAIARPFPVAQYFIIALLLAWPSCAGIVAINNLLKANA